MLFKPELKEDAKTARRRVARGIGRRLVSQSVLGWRDDNLTAFRPARWLSLR